MTFPKNFHKQSRLNGALTIIGYSIQYISKFILKLEFFKKGENVMVGKRLHTLHSYRCTYKGAIGPVLAHP